MDGTNALQVRLRQVGPIPLDVQFAVPTGCITALFGPSGSGKTTVLRSIAGLYVPREAEVRWGEVRWSDTRSGFVLPTHRRPIGFVFQHYALFPHLTVRSQVALALGPRPPRDRPRRVEELLSLTRLEALAERKPASLSGGQQQRVALARALARDPAVLLLDEPFAAVDFDLRDALRHELRALQRRLSLTVVIVTHDFQDVARLASRIVVLDRGTMTAATSVEEITATNALPGRGEHWEPTVAMDATVVSHDESRLLTHLAARELRVAVPSIEAPPGALVRVQIPARDVILASRRPEGLSLHNVLEARVLQVEPTSHPALRLVHLAVGNTRLLSLVTVDAVRNLSLEPGARVFALVKAVAVAAFT